MLAAVYCLSESHPFGESARTTIPDLDLCPGPVPASSPSRRRAGEPLERTDPGPASHHVATVAVVAHHASGSRAKSVCTTVTIISAPWRKRLPWPGLVTDPMPPDCAGARCPTDQVTTEANVLHQRRFVHAGGGATIQRRWPITRVTESLATAPAMACARSARRPWLARQRHLVATVFPNVAAGLLAEVRSGSIRWACGHQLRRAGKRGEAVRIQRGADLRSCAA